MTKVFRKIKITVITQTNTGVPHKTNANRKQKQFDHNIKNKILLIV